MPGTKELVAMTTEGQRKEPAREICDHSGSLSGLARLELCRRLFGTC